MVKKGILLGIFIAILIIMTGCTTDTEKREQAKQISQVEQETTAPDILLKMVRGNGQQLRLRDIYMDKPVFLNFWASWCPPCVKEMPHIDALYKKYGDKINFVVINMDSNEGDVRAFLQNNSFEIPIYRGDLNSISEAYHVNAIPISFIIDKRGKIISQHTGGMSEREMEKFLGPIL
ncbi:MAG: TlpA family protein disulfide reductase [Megasphaera sp.]|jgi:thiol-disulfide isomerase/thioredoxin|uniref:TlpA family protein disulfide reductase n=1 Tax=Megasphaera sueciensis TaxID=349094 RepID=UPI003D03B005|nr:TlpA family protein disulfide reductase [Megasphaera sp.]MCI1823123.1 TlpA family protein disulfide reductase [Megasphaera sp.]